MGNKNRTPGAPLLAVQPALAYTVSQAAKLVSSSRSQLYEDIGAGRLATIKNRGRRLVRHEAVVAYLDLLESESDQLTRWRR